ncbi:MAG: aquaporin [Pyrinomonadaceae bacterium]|nr:aquaporin [Pyrinomonadaceae bacterium]
MLEAFRNHWLEYVCEALGLGVFMVSACVFSVLLFHPFLPTANWNLQLRFVLIGLAMGLTAVAIFKSPFGKLSGAHINPAVTLTFWRLGKIKSTDAVFYVLFQFIGATFGVFFSWLILWDFLANKDVNFAITIPNSSGWMVSFIAEFIISFGMMTMVLITSNHAKLSRFTPYFAGILVAIYISLEAPVSGMSMNPARTFGSAMIANVWNSWWIYFVAPPLAMLAAAEIFVRLKGRHSVLCAKFDHHSKMRCIFNCNFGEMVARETR